MRSLALLCLAALAGPTWAQQATVVPILNQFGAATSVSPNGQYVCGFTSQGAYADHGFVWTRAHGIERSFQVPNCFQTNAVSVNDTGIVSGDYLSNAEGIDHIGQFISTPSDLIDIGHPDNVDSGTLRNWQILNDGSVLAPARIADRVYISVYDSVHGYTVLPNPPNTIEPRGFRASSVTGVVAGSSTSVEDDYVTVLWRCSNGTFTELSRGFEQPVEVAGVNFDATKVLFGNFGSLGLWQTWEEGIGFLTHENDRIHGLQTEMFKMSEDGSTLGGHYGQGHIPAIFKNGQFYDLAEYLRDHGANVQGWRFDRITGLSADGNTIVGGGWYNGQFNGFVATVPEPSTFAGLGMLLAGTLFRRRLVKHR